MMSDQNTHKHGMQNLFGKLPSKAKREAAPRLKSPALTATSAPPEAQSPTLKATSAPPAPLPVPPKAPVPAAPLLDDLMPELTTENDPVAAYLDAEATAPPPQVVPLKEPSSKRPDFTFVVFLGSPLALAERTLRAIAEQSANRRVGVIVICDDSLSAIARARLQHCHRVHILPVIKGDTDGKCFARAVRLSTAPIIALLDWHAVPSRNFAAHVLRQSDEAWDVFGPRFSNANPSQGASWASMLPQTLPLQGTEDGRAAWLPSRNVVYRRQALLELGDDLPQLVDSSRLSEALAEKNCQFVRDREAQIWVLNPSRFWPMMQQRYLVGRLLAADDCKRRKFSPPGRFLRAVRQFLSPMRNYRQHKSALFGSRDGAAQPERHRSTVRWGYFAESYGRLSGYLLGPGKARKKLAAKNRHAAIALDPSDAKKLIQQRMP